jgi:hypothetical protein
MHHRLRASWLLASGPLLALSAACAGRTDSAGTASDTLVSTGPCATAGLVETCFNEGVQGSQRCLPDLMEWSTCAPPGQTPTATPAQTPPAPPPGCTVGDKKACDLGSGFQGAQVCVATTSSTTWTDCCGGQNTVACTTPNGQAGVALCSGGQVQSGCGVVDGCNPADYPNSSGCVLADGTWMWESAGGSDTPLVLAFDGERVVFTQAAGAFDLSGRNASYGSRWVSARTPWLALDVDGNGRIDDGEELFGSMTALPGGGRASNGFDALAVLDDDGDGMITARDRSFERLLVWSDADQDRRSSRDEIVSAGEAGIVAIRLDYVVAARCDGSDCERERARFVFRGADGVEREGSVVDVHLARR